MRTRHLSKPREAKRAIPPAELRIIEPLVEDMGRVWGLTTPPNSSLARKLVYSPTFMGLRRFSPFFPEVLGGKRLVDLGAGFPDAMTHFALRSKVSEYVAVDRYLDYSRIMPPFANVSYVNADMLRFLAEQHDGSANVIMLAIDDIVLHCGNKMTETLYAGMLLAEIRRVVPDGGIAIGFNSELLDGLMKMGFAKLEKIPGHAIPNQFLPGGIFQKN